MIRIEIEVSVPDQANDVMAMSAFVADQLLDLRTRGAVVHRITVEEADA
ncbi:MAG: hypothetical protein ACRDOJ_11980 [Nocardioidaceae bacterium]